LSYIYLTSMCVACCFKSFGDSKCNTCSDLSLRYSFVLLRLRPGYPGRSLSTYHKAFLCGSHPMVSLEVSFLAVPLKELVVLGGTVSRYLTVLPSGIIFQPSVRHSATFLDDAYRLRQLHRCPNLRLVGTRQGISLWLCYHSLS